MKTEHRRRLLRTLYKRCKGRCTNCNVEVGLVFQLVAQGWELLEREGVLVSPKGQVVFVGTIEHLHPKGKGGSNNLSNLTLYCAHCNRKTSHFGMSPKPESTEEMTEDKDFAKRSKALWDKVTENGKLIVVPEAPDVDEEFWLGEKNLQSS